MKISSPIPKRLKIARQRLKISQKELGIRAGIDAFSASPRMNQYEKGVHTPDYQTAFRISEQLGVLSCYLFCDDDEFADIIMSYSSLDQQDRPDFIKAVKRLMAYKYTPQEESEEELMEW